MFYWSFIAFVTALVAGLLGFGGTTANAAALAQGLFFVLIAVAIGLAVVNLATSERD